MPVPDLTPYVDLTLDDRSAQDLFDGFVAAAQALAPEYSPAEGKPSVIIAQAIFTAIEELIFAVNRLPGAVLEPLGIRGYDLPRDVGAAATGDVSFLLNDSTGHTLLAGTRVAIDVAGVPVTFTTDTDVIVAAGNDNGVVGITADQIGAAVNGIIAGTPVQVLDSVPFLDEMSLSTALAGGRDPETSEAYLTRLAAVLQRQTIALVVPSQFASAALEVAGVGRALALDRYNPAVGPVGANLGHESIVLADPAGAAVAAGVAAAVTAEISPMTQGGLTLHLLDPTVTAVDVTLTVHRDATISDATAVANVTAALDAYLSPATWPWASTVYRTELAHAARAVAGITRVEDPTVPAADEALPGVGPLASPGVITVNVVGP